MSGWKWLRVAAFAGLLFTLAACSKSEAPPRPAANPDDPQPSKTSDQKVELHLDATSPDHEAVGLSDQTKDFAARTANLSTVTNSLEKAGAGTLTLSGANTFTGGTSTTAGTLALPGLSGRSGATNNRLLQMRGGNGRAPRPGLAAAGQPADLLDEHSDHDNTENYQPIFDNPYKLAKNDPLSTISSAVDTASYSNVRARLNAGQLPPKDAVRIADMLNYFNYDYASPKNDDPVAFHLEIAPCPWQPKHQLLRIGLKAKTIDKDKMPPRNLVFLIDTSGSMGQPNRLPLVQQSLHLLIDQLTERDRVSIVTYAGAAELLLTPTPGNEKGTIGRVIDSLNANGSTNGGGGIVMAYDQAQASFIKGGLNRVILATDGDFNVGVSSDAELVRLIEAKRETGVYLTILGYGMGNLKDSKLEQLAHHGNGHYAYIDTLDEAKKVFVEQGGSLVMVAKDVKLQVEFNPAKVAGYRLIGYENRILRHEDFRNDKKDAGDMGSGHMCTALYEIVPAGVQVESGEVEPLKYQTTPKLSVAAKSGEWATVRMRYKHPETDKAKEVEAALTANAKDQKTSNDFEFAACVASFGMLLRESEFKGVATYQSLLETAEGLLRDKKDAYREEFVKLVRVALTIGQAQKKE